MTCLQDRQVYTGHMQLIGHLTALTHLDLSLTNVTDSGLQSLRNLKFLRELILENTKIHDTGKTLILQKT